MLRGKLCSEFFSKLIKSIFLISLISSSLVACNSENIGGKEGKPTEAINKTLSVNQTTSEQTIEEETTSTDLNKVTAPDQTNFSWQKLSGWHTQGTISRNSSIKVLFNRDIVGSELLGKDASHIIHISPAVKGTPIFESLSKITLLPDEPLKAGIEYKVSIKPKGLLDIPKNTAPFQFSFHVIPLEFEVKSLGLTTVPDTENDMLLTGRLLVSDRVNSESVKKVLKAKFQGKQLPIEWTHSRNGRTHKFTVKNITKETFATDVKLFWNGESIHVKSNSTLEVAVPTLSDFKLMDLSIIEDAGTNPYIQAQFSDVINKQQNLKGLVELAKNKYKVGINQNTINIYPNKNINGTFTVRFNQGIKSNTNKVLSKNIERKISFGETKPQVKFVGKGSILPENTTLEIPFMAVGVNAVEVTASEIFPDNMGQFLQNNRLSGNLDTQRSGRFLWRKTIPLTPANPNKWNRYSFNVTELMKEHHSGLLRLTLTIKKQHSTYSCTAKNKKQNKLSKPLRNMVDIGVYQPLKQDSLQDFEQQQNNYYDYDWDNRNNPCHNAYFSYYNRSKTTVNQNFIASNIGLIAKQDSKGDLHIISTDLRTAEPLTGVDFEVRNFQGQKLGEAQSDGSGFANIPLNQTPFLVIAKKFKDTAYLKVNARTTLPVSQFDVGGKKTKNGLKGIIYGERGVWRPGDNIFLTFVIEDSNSANSATSSISALPENHPVTMKLIDPRGRVVETQTKTNSVGGFYTFKFKTKEKAQTGSWIAKAFLGGSTFSKSLMIETVRPNRLKLDLSFNDKNDKNADTIFSSDGTPKGSLFSQWLHGATASNLKADISVKFSKKKTSFSTFPDYSFDDPARILKSEDKMLLEGRLNEEGYLNFSKSLKPKTQAPGMLKAQFTTRVFEQGGAFSISRSSFDYHPYKQYVGLKLPESKSSYSLLHTNQQHTISIASVSDKGDAVSLDKVRVSLYKINWRWWWDKPRESLAEFADGKHTDLLNNAIINTVDGKAQWQFKVKKSEWGRYLIRVCDLEGKHCAGKTTYIDWPDWSGRAQESGSTAASRLELFTDKKAYTVGETAVLQLPSIHSGSALLSIETGSQILEQRWLDLKKLASSDTDKNQIEIPITAEMSPNAYVHVSVLQPHKDKSNDRPIRLYGIIPLEVANPETYLSPKILVDKEWKPQSTQTIKISEKNSKQMNYTLAVVDEGLLGLTAFKTPNLHKHFYSKEALGIKTWDLYDEVIGAYGGKLERMLALGGGDEAEIDNEDSKKRRFPPVVRFLGPFSLDAGETAEHKIDLPPYLGAVRVMVVAGSKGELSDGDSNDNSNSSPAYGKAQESVFIRQPLMLQVSLPRTLGPDEEVAVPVTLFATDDSIKDVTVEIQTDDLINLVGDDTAEGSTANSSNTTKVHFDKTGEKIAFIKIKTAKKSGKTHLRFIASAMTEKGLQKSEADVYLNIDHANTATSRSITKIIEPQSTWSSKANAFGLTGTNKAILELSSVPPLNLEKRLNYLIRYPHGCLEQTTSSVFPQLFLSNVIALDDKKQAESQKNIEQGIQRLQRFQRSSGDFSYWPGGNYENAWASVYAGHFLIEAKKKGFLIPKELLNDWIDQQINSAQGFIASSYNNDIHTQAYRLYVLALAGSPQLGAMNRLREQGNTKSARRDKKLNNKSRWLLASAYQTASQPDAANSLIEGLLPEVSDVNSTGTTFRSTLGDLGLQLESLVTLNKKQDANSLLEKIADEMAGDSYQSTQGIAWALLAVSKYLGGDTSNFTADFSETSSNTLSNANKSESNINSNKAISSTTLANPNSEITLKNTSTIKLFATLINTGVPDAGIEQSIEKGLSLDVEFAVRDEKNKELWRSIVGSSILQGSDVKFTVTVSNNSKQNAKNIALTIPVAAGMEILSATEHTQSSLEKTQKNTKQYDYRDLRDDRIHYYFSLKRGQQKTFTLTANASYKGRYYLPAINVEAMYDGSLKARQKGSWINIVESDAISIIDKKEVSIRWHKSYLYDSPDDSSRTKMYLVGGDKVSVLNKATTSDNTRWLFIRFKGTKTLEKWIKAETTE